MRHFLDNFVNQTRNELFPLREACYQYFSDGENFRRLLAREIGENLMHKHNALASF